jgi:hypothetical protein
MLLLSSQDDSKRQRVGWCVAVVLLAVTALTFSLATRTFRLTVAHKASVQCSAAQARRQHMDRDAARWVPPVPVLTALETPSFFPHVAPAGPPLPVLLLDEPLYNRPPPSRG